MAANRFFRPGNTKIYVLPAVGNVNAITTAEMATAEDITCEVAEMSGFTFKNDPIDTPTMCSPLILSIPGNDKMEQSSFTFYEKRDTAAPTAANPLRAMFAKSETMVVVIFPQGIAGIAPAAGDLYDAWPAISAGVAREYGTKEAARWVADLSITGIPAQDAVLV